MTPRPGTYAILAYNEEFDEEPYPLEDGLDQTRAATRVEELRERASELGERVDYELVYEDVPLEEGRVFKSPALARRSKRPGA